MFRRRLKLHPPEGAVVVVLVADVVAAVGVEEPAEVAEEGEAEVDLEQHLLLRKMSRPYEID
jgi:hypothetical protein